MKRISVGFFFLEQMYQCLIAFYARIVSGRVLKAVCKNKKKVSILKKV